MNDKPQTLLEASENFAESVKALGRVLRDDTPIGRFIVRLADRLLGGLEWLLTKVTR